MSLFILVGIVNIDKTFLFIFCFIILKSASIFELNKIQLNELFFHNLLCSKVIYCDVAKGLAKTIAA